MQPDWAIIGIRWETGVAIIASNELTYGELKIEWNDIRSEYYGLCEKVYAHDMVPDIQAMVRARRVLWLQGPDYKTVWENLMKQWSPQPKAAKQIEGRNATELL